MRQDRFTLDNLMKYIYGEQISKIPTKLYNDDAQVKYLDFGSLYTYCCHGSKEHQIRRWLRERIAYVDSMLGYFTSQEDQVTIRMNKTGYVSFEVTPYIPLYFSVKWSNATGGTQTFKLKRGETKTFYYTSTTSTDQEVLIYHAQHIKRLDNLSNLNPSSCILANAKKLTNVEIHSKELYNINVTNNIFLRNINLRDCSTLGTVTATGSSLDLSRCKYLRHCDVYNTALTEVQLDTSGGSLVDIYYPKTIQSINLIKQRLLETVGLPYGTKGEEVPTSLYNISIQECPNIKKLNTSSDPEISSSFASMVYCNNLTLRNSLDLATLNFDGFYRLKNVVIENMYNLQAIGFNNLLPAGETSTLKYVGMSNCPKLSTFELNCTSNEYEITLADDAILNLGGLISLKSITSNCVLKGIKTIIVPTGLDSMFFTNTYGSGYSTIKNIWVSSQCNVNTGGTTPTVTHVNGGYEGIDFAGMNLKNIDLGALVNIPKAINFSLSPTTVNPHFNKNRDGSTYPYLQPEGTLDLTNYTESLARFFDGVDLDKLQIVCNGNLPQTDLSYCFYNSSFSSEAVITTLLSKVSSITNLDYCFYRTTITSTDILSSINMGTSSTMNYTFAECPNITSLSGVIISRNVTAVEGMFYKCPLTSINNITVNVAGSISGLFKGCSQLTSITNLRIPNVSDASGTFEGCSKLAVLSGFELPASCTNVSNLFKGCYMLTELAMNFGSNITEGTDWYPPNLETLNDSTISSNNVKLTNCSTLRNINNLTLRVSDLTDFFTGTASLKNINGIDIGGTLTSVEGLFKDKTLTTLQNITFGASITNFTSCFENVPCITNTTLINMPNHENKTLNYSRMFAGCLGITQVIDTIYPDSGTNYSNMYTGCTNITKLSNLTIQGGVLLGMFSGCTGITSVSNVVTSKAISMSDMFSGCPKIESITLNVPNTCKNMDGLLQGCSMLTDISGSTFGSGVTSATNWITGAPITTANNVTIKNNVIKFTGNKTLQYAKNLSRPNSTNWDNYFEGCISLKEDIIFPNNTISVIECYKDCTSMTHIHSNWNNTYDNEITSTNCYAGCTGITHCDDIDLGINEYVSGLDEVPVVWGGYGFSKTETGIYVVNIPNDGYKFEMTFGTTCLLGDGIINWGDGNVSKKSDLPYEAYVVSNKYEKAGTYVIKGNVLWIPRLTVDKNVLSKVIQAPKARYINGTLYMSKFSSCSNVTYINVTNMVTNSINVKRDLGELFQKCTSLTTIVGLDTWDTTYSYSMGEMFGFCESLSEVNLGDWEINNCDQFDQMFSRSALSVIDTTRWIKDKNKLYSLFRLSAYMPNLNKIIIDGFKFNNIQQLGYNCPKLKEVYITNCDLGEMHENGFDFSFYNTMTTINFSGSKNLNIPCRFDWSLLSVESLISILEALKDLNGETAKTITLGSNVSRLTPQQIKIATDKNWTVV